MIMTERIFGVGLSRIVARDAYDIVTLTVASKSSR
jgi:hypothetical protein